MTIKSDKISRANRIYISGPIRSQGPSLTYERYNEDAFRAAEVYLKGRGFDVVNPITIAYDTGKENNEPNLDNIPVSEWLRIDFRALLSCECIIMLKNWHYSQGAVAEWRVASLCGMPVYKINDAGNLKPENRVPLGSFAEEVIRKCLVKGLNDHGAESWAGEPSDHHQSCAIGHLVTAKRQRVKVGEQFSKKMDDEVHHVNALVRTAMLAKQISEGDWII